MFSFYRTSIGKKFIVAVSGALLFGFLVLHMLGNLKAFAGFDTTTGAYKLDLYALFLRSMAHEMVGNYTILWTTRAALFGALVLHVVTVIQLQLAARRSRPVAYAKTDYDSASYAARSMFWGGVLLLFFIVYHLLHFTTGDLHMRGFVEGQVYSNVYNAFSSGAIVSLYLVAMGVLGLHLYHGVWSLFQTLGFDRPGRNKLFRGLACLAALGLFLGFISVPVAVFAGLLSAPGN